MVLSLVFVTPTEHRRYKDDNKMTGVSKIPVIGLCRPHEVTAWQLLCSLFGKLDHELDIQYHC